MPTATVEVQALLATGGLKRGETGPLPVDDARQLIDAGLVKLVGRAPRGFWQDAQPDQVLDVDPPPDDPDGDDNEAGSDDNEPDATEPEAEAEAPD